MLHSLGNRLWNTDTLLDASAVYAQAKKIQKQRRFQKSNHELRHFRWGQIRGGRNLTGLLGSIQPYHTAILADRIDREAYIRQW
jgi:hypothetical protein